MGRKYVAGRPIDLRREVVRDKQGRRIDQAYADRLVASADAVRPKGRPGLGDKPGPSPQIAVRLPADTYARVVKTARKRGISLAALTREAVEHYLAS